ncbi:MAG: SPOR domain-containing protein [Thermodesulfobacteriota bacterium]|nr:SPOR domain-containing protein [Thermodesulfobacteriota bacterium]
MTKKTSERKKSFWFMDKGTGKWICLIFFASAWMFVLGIFVGRGTAPVKFDIENIQKELIALKEAVIKEGQGRFKIGRDPASAKMELGFYEALKETRPSVRHKVKPTVPKKTVSPQKKAKVGAGLSRPLNEFGRGKPAPTAAGAGFTIQVASLKDMKAAAEMAEMLKKKGYQAYTVLAKIPGRGAWHRIRIGDFKNKEDAGDILSRLKKDKYRPIVVQK